MSRKTRKRSFDMKLYKGDIIEFTFGTVLKLKARVLSDKGTWGKPHKIKVLDDNYKDLADELSCYNYASIFGSGVDPTSVKLIRPGWIRRQRRPFIKRLKYLFLNRF
jgi:hypothetical protein